jgi:glycogen operon protein
MGLRERQKRNFLATLLLSQGVPMLCGGDELGRTQQGNNNAYCQDNELSWYDWKLDRRDRSLLEFTQRCIRLRRKHPALRRRQFFFGRRIHGSEVKDLTWFRPDGHEMTEDDWNNGLTRCLGLRIAGDALDEVDARGEPVRDETLLVLLNAFWEPVHFVLPAHKAGVRWEVLLDTRTPDGRRKSRPLRGGEPYDLEARTVTLFRLGGRD